MAADKTDYDGRTLPLQYRQRHKFERHSLCVQPFDKPPNGQGPRLESVKTLSPPSTRHIVKLPAQVHWPHWQCSRCSTRCAVRCAHLAHRGPRPPPQSTIWSFSTLASPPASPAALHCSNLSSAQQSPAASRRGRSLARAQLQHPDSTHTRMCWKCARACGGDGCEARMASTDIIQSRTLQHQRHDRVATTAFSGHASPRLSGTLSTSETPCPRRKRLHVEWVAIEHGQQCVGHVVASLSKNTSASLPLVAARICIGPHEQVRTIL